MDQAVASKIKSSPGPEILHFVRTPDVEKLFANIPRWQIESHVLSRPQGISQGGAMRLGAVGVASNHFMSAVHALGSVPARHLSLGLDTSRRPGRRFAGHELHEDDAVIGYDGSDLDYITPMGFRGLSLTLPGPLVEHALELRGFPGESLRRFQHTRASRIDRSGLPGIWEFFAQLVDLLQSGHTTGASPLALAQIQAGVIDAATTIVGALALPSTPDHAPYWHHRRPIVQSAEEFMRANLGEPIMLHHICSAAKASERTVEYAFRDIYGMGAKRYLKLLRLNRVRRELRAPEAASITIQEIAYRAGFWHMGHFSSEYRRLFGERPTQTRDRARH